MSKKREPLTNTMVDAFLATADAGDPARTARIRKRFTVKQAQRGLALLRSLAALHTEPWDTCRHCLALEAVSSGPDGIGQLRALLDEIDASTACWKELGDQLQSGGMYDPAVLTGMLQAVLAEVRDLRQLLDRRARRRRVAR